MYPGWDKFLINDWTDCLIIAGYWRPGTLVVATEAAEFTTALYIDCDTMVRFQMHFV